MICQICNKYPGKRYIAFPNTGSHRTEDILVLSICNDCILVWFKAIPEERRREIRHWILRSCTFKLKMEPQPNGMWKTIGYGPEEEDLSI